MSQSSMRGMRLGGQSFETERNITFEARSSHTYRCPEGHETQMTFSAIAEVPNSWECKCSRSGILLIDGVPVEEIAGDVKAPRSHWQMLLERRSVEELEVLLDEQLENLRARRESAKIAMAS